MALPASVTTSIKEQADLLVDVNYIATGKEVNDRISLGKEIVYAIDTAEKNGTAIVQGTDYTWNTYRPNIQTTSSFSAGDHFFFRLQTGLKDEVVDEERDRVHNHIKAELAGFYNYDDVDIDASITIQSLIIEWVSGRLMMIQSKGVALESAMFRSGQERVENAKKALKTIKSGGSELLDSSDDKLARIAGSVVGGDDSTDSGDRLERHEILEALHDYDDTVQDWLETIDV